MDLPIRPRSVLIVVAHPDDCEFGCGGTAARLAAGGAEIHLVVVTDGALGSHDPAVDGAALAATREAEQRRAAEVLGLAGVTFLGVPDGTVRVTDELVRRLVEQIHAVRPELVVTHDPWRHYMVHPDHLAVGEAAWRAAWAAREPRLSAGQAVRDLEIWLFAAEAPDLVVDITEFEERREAAVMCHASQKPNAMKYAEGDEAAEQAFLAGMRERAAAVGERGGVRYGEEFKRVVPR